VRGGGRLSKRFFFEKKEPKNFFRLCAGAWWEARVQSRESLFASFSSEKEDSFLEE
jgi:hypothetical protein